MIKISSMCVLVGLSAVAQEMWHPPVLAGEETPLRGQLGKGVSCWVGDGKAWTYDSSVVIALKVPDRIRDRKLVGANRRILPKGIDARCFTKPPGDELQPELKELIKTNRFLAVMRDAETGQCLFNDIAGSRVLKERFQDQDSTAVIEPCDNAKTEARLKQAGVPEKYIKEVIDYLK